MIYADYNATTPIPPRVVDKMLPYLTSEFGNPSSTAYALGSKAREAVEDAREAVSRLIGCSPKELVFLSGGTESCAHAILGYLRACGAPGKIVYSAVEHPCVVETVRFAEEMKLAQGVEIPVDREGRLDLSDLDRALPGKNVILSLMTANNETGVWFPLDQALAAAKRAGAAVHTDAVQAAGKRTLNFSASGTDFLSISAHKFGGPKGIGALAIREGTAWKPVIKGGAQEQGRRGGTEAVALIVGMGEAARIRLEYLQQGKDAQLEQLRDKFEREICSAISGIVINGRAGTRLPNTSSLRIDGINAQEIMSALARRGIAISVGSACSTPGSAESAGASKHDGHKASRVLTSMGLNSLECLATVRISLSFETTDEEVVGLVQALQEETAAQRALTADTLNKLTGRPPLP